MRLVPAEEWRAAARRARDEGLRWFDWLGCVDEVGRSDDLRLVLALRDLDDPGRPPLLLGCLLPRDEPRVESLREEWAGAAWPEREVAELFGVTFVGGDRRRLLLGPGFEGTPLRKDDVLAARTAAPWPGAKEPGEGDGASRPGVAAPSRRRMVPPGVPDAAVWGDRDPAGPAPSPEEVAASAVGGRVRRRGRS